MQGAYELLTGNGLGVTTAFAAGGIDSLVLTSIAKGDAVQKFGHVEHQAQ